MRLGPYAVSGPNGLSDIGRGAWGLQWFFVQVKKPYLPLLATGFSLSRMSIPRRRCRKEREWLTTAVHELKDAGWKVRFDKQKEYRGGFFGYCIDQELHVAVGRRGWFPIFVHEYSHFRQEQEGMWVRAKDTNALIRFDEWIGYRREIPRYRALEACRSVLGCEYDAEARAVRLMRYKRFKSVDLERYIRGANVYLWSHVMALKYREWFLPAVRWGKVRNKLTLKVPKWFEALYVEKCGCLRTSKARGGSRDKSR